MSEIRAVGLAVLDGIGDAYNFLTHAMRCQQRYAILSLALLGMVGGIAASRPRVYICYSTIEPQRLYSDRERWIPAFNIQTVGCGGM